MRKLIAAAALGLAALTAAAPAAAQVDARQYNQERRINQGVRSGELTPREANRLSRQQNNIARQEQRMRYRNGGYLNGRQRARLTDRQLRANRAIYRAKHNGRVY